MKITVVLIRNGSSRVSFDSIPISAHIQQGHKHGDDLVEKLRPTTIEMAKGHVQTELDRRFGRAVEIVWVDRTNEGRNAS